MNQPLVVGSLGFYAVAAFNTRRHALGFQQISELLPIQGIEFVGPVPAEVQLVTVCSAGVGKAARHPDRARAFNRVPSVLCRHRDDPPNGARAVRGITR